MDRTAGQPQHQAKYAGCGCAQTEQSRKKGKKRANKEEKRKGNCIKGDIRLARPSDGDDAPLFRLVAPHRKKERDIVNKQQNDGTQE